MKKTIFIIPLIIAGAFFIGCGDSKDEDTTLGFVNSDASDNSINNIAWSGAPDLKWSNGDTGFEKGAQTDSKAVAAGSGTVECDVYTVENGFQTAAVYFEATTSDSITVADGANLYTLQATSGSASVTKK